MDIETAFTQEAIETFGTNVEGEEERDVREMIRKVYTANEMPHTSNGNEENVAVLAFVAGRTYQADQETESEFLMPMTQTMMAEFIGFLVEKRGAGA